MNLDNISSDFTLLTEEQIYGNKRLDLFDQIGPKAALTDFAILLGAYASNNYYIGKEKLENRTGWYWVCSNSVGNNIRTIGYFGGRNYHNIQNRFVACRPVLSLSSISEISMNQFGYRKLDSIFKIEYGNYPQKAAEKEKQFELENAFQQSKLKITGNKFAVDSRKYDEYEKEFKAKEILEYEYQGKYYVRVEANTCFDGHRVQLSNGEYYYDGDYVWIEVSPIKWFVDEKADLVISENLLFAGIQFHHEKINKGDFSKTDLKIYLDRYFAKEFMQRHMMEEKEEDLSKEKLLKELKKLKLRVQEQKDKIEKLENETKLKQLKK